MEEGLSGGQPALDETRGDAARVGADEDHEIGPVVDLRERRRHPAAALHGGEVGGKARTPGMIDDGTQPLGQRHGRAHAGGVDPQAGHQGPPARRQELRCPGDGGLELDRLALDPRHRLAERSGEGLARHSTAIGRDPQLCPFGCHLEIIACQRAERTDGLGMACRLNHSASSGPGVGTDRPRLTGICALH